MTPFADLKKTGKKLFGDFGAWAFDEWKTLNETFFNGENCIDVLFCHDETLT